MRIPCRATAVGASICITTSAISRLIRAQALLTASDNLFSDQVESAIRQVTDDLNSKLLLITSAGAPPRVPIPSPQGANHSGSSSPISKLALYQPQYAHLSDGNV